MLKMNLPQYYIYRVYETKLAKTVIMKYVPEINVTHKFCGYKSVFISSPFGAVSNASVSY